MRSPKNRRRLEFIRENSSTPGPATCFPTPRSSGLTISTLNTTPFLASLRVLWRRSGTTLVPSYTQRTSPEISFPSGKLIQKPANTCGQPCPWQVEARSPKATTVKATLFATRLMPRLLPHRPVESERLVRSVDISEFNIALVVSSAGARRRPIHHIRGHLNPI